MNPELNSTRRRLILQAGLQAGIAASLGTIATRASAQGSAATFPDKPIRILVPYAAGGSVDFVCRIVAQKLAQAWGQGVLVDNKPGGGTNIAAETTLHSPADGYTLFAASRGNSINAALYKKINFDIQKDFVPITLLAEIPNVLVVNPALPAKNVAELVALAKAQPGALSFASAGTAGSTHLAGELFNSMAGTAIVHVPYKGGSQAVVDVISGQVAMYFGTMPSVMSYVRAGKLRALAVTSLRRSAIEPGLPTLDELGMKGYNETSWIGLMAPAGTPAPVVARLYAEVSKILAQPEVKAQLAAQGAEALKATPAEFSAFLRKDIVRTADIVAKAHIVVE